MRALWVKVFLTAFALQLTLPTHHTLNFGDMIAFDRAVLHQRPFLVHWAIYVGKGNVTGLDHIKKNEEDIFELTGPILEPMLSGCVFGQIKNQAFRVSNYLDRNSTGYGLDVRTREQMTNSIQILYKNCSFWKPLVNNCEHIATFIRYGIPHCEQRDSRCFGPFKKNKEKMDNRIKQDRILPTSGA